MTKEKKRQGYDYTMVFGKCWLFYSMNNCKFRKNEINTMQHQIKCFVRHGWIARRIQLSSHCKQKGQASSIREYISFDERTNKWECVEMLRIKIQFFCSLWQTSRPVSTFIHSHNVEQAISFSALSRLPIDCTERGFFQLNTRAHSSVWVWIPISIPLDGSVLLKYRPFA